MSGIDKYRQITNKNTIELLESSVRSLKPLNKTKPDESYRVDKKQKNSLKLVPAPVRVQVTD